MSRSGAVSILEIEVFEGEDVGTVVGCVDYVDVISRMQKCDFVLAGDSQTWVSAVGLICLGRRVGDIEPEGEPDFQVSAA